MSGYIWASIAKIEDLCTPGNRSLQPEAHAVRLVNRRLREVYLEVTSKHVVQVFHINVEDIKYANNVTHTIFDQAHNDNDAFSSLISKALQLRFVVSLLNYVEV